MRSLIFQRVPSGSSWRIVQSHASAPVDRQAGAVRSGESSPRNLACAETASENVFPARSPGEMLVPPPQAAVRGWTASIAAATHPGPYQVSCSQTLARSARQEMTRRQQRGRACPPPAGV
jgi:hypothetical protein